MSGGQALGRAISQLSDSEGRRQRMFTYFGSSGANSTQI